MKQFEIYRNIRKGAVIFGLPVASFALMMIIIIGSLLVIIFSFSFWVIIGVLIANSLMYLVLLKITRTPELFPVSSVFPNIISNKRISEFNYEQD